MQTYGEHRQLVENDPQQTLAGAEISHCIEPADRFSPIDYAARRWLGAADAIRSPETARVHRDARRRSSVAARGARAAEAADYWAPGPRHASSFPSSDQCVCAAAPRTWMDRRSGAQ